MQFNIASQYVRFVMVEVCRLVFSYCLCFSTYLWYFIIILVFSIFNLSATLYLSVPLDLSTHSSSIQRLLWTCRGYTAICPTAGPVSTQRVRDVPLQCRPATTITAPVLRSDRVSCRRVWSCCSHNSTGPISRGQIKQAFNGKSAFVIQIHSFSLFLSKDWRPGWQLI